MRTAHSLEQIDDIREEFRSTLQQQIQLALQQALQGTINTTQVSNGPSVDNNFITPPRIDDATEENDESRSLLTTQKVVDGTTTSMTVDETTTITTKSAAIRNLFDKKDGQNRPPTYVSAQQLMRTRNQKKLAGKRRTTNMIRESFIGDYRC